MKIEESDRVTLGRVCFILDTPRHLLMPLLSRSGVPVEMDPDTGQVFTSRSALGKLFIRAVSA